MMANDEQYVSSTYDIKLLNSLRIVADNIKESVIPKEALNCIINNSTKSRTMAELINQCLPKVLTRSDNEEKTKCYDELGCFPMNYPWVSFLRPMPPPFSPQKVATKLFLFTRTMKKHNVTLWPKINLSGSGFNATRQATVFITHGFANNADEPWVHEMKDAYLKRVDANVFITDWGSGAENEDYFQVASNTRIVGAELARFGKWLTSKGLDACKIHLLGHSLGSHISAYFAKAVPGIGRLTAMDPAQPSFEGPIYLHPLDKRVRLDKSDAKFVDVIHTSASPFIPTLGFGMIYPLGDVDFYVNGGVQQPGCLVPNVPFELKTISELSKISVEDLANYVSCSHRRAYEVMTDAINNTNCLMWGHAASALELILNSGTQGEIGFLQSKNMSCGPKSCTALGLYTPLFQGTGSFLVTTSSKSPYCESNRDDDIKTLHKVFGQSGVRSFPFPL